MATIAQSAETDDLIIGAARIAEDVFEDKLNQRQVYRLAEEGGWPFFRVRNKLACRRSTMRAHIARLEAEAAGRAA